MTDAICVCVRKALFGLLSLSIIHLAWTFDVSRTRDLPTCLSRFVGLLLIKPAECGTLLYIRPGIGKIFHNSRKHAFE